MKVADEDPKPIALPASRRRRRWYAIWSAWLLLIVLSFGVLEGIALYQGEDDAITLSRWTWDLTLAWPLFPVLYGGIFLGLAVHFFWHWSPPGSSSHG